MKRIKKFNFAKLHRALWLWISKHPEKERTDWPGFKRIRFGLIGLPWVRDNCFACEATHISIAGKSSALRSGAGCTKCPLQWPGGITCNYDLPGGDDGLYDGFIFNHRNGNFKAVSRIAAHIADLKWVGNKIFVVEYFKTEKTRLPRVFFKSDIDETFYYSINHNIYIQCFFHRGWKFYRPATGKELKQDALISGV